MTILFSVIMSVCIIPILLIMFFMLYPKNIEKSKLILGVTARKEYTEGETFETVREFCRKRRSQALKIMIACFIIAGLSFFVRRIVFLTTGWLVFVLAAFVGITLPFYLGNRDMKNLKKRLGIGGEKKVTLTDFNNVGAIHTLKLKNVLPPVIFGFLILVAALLIDFKVIHIKTAVGGTFICSVGAAVFLFTELLVIIVAYVLDGLKNEVISTDSAINANYNRAKKKNMSDFTVKMLWIQSLLIASFVVFIVLWYSEIGIIICYFFYLIILMLGICVFIKRDRRIESRYAKEMTVTEDEDDYWIGGILYCNPNNKRINIKKRVGVGATINLGHPIGKVISILIALVLLASIGAMVYVGIAAETPLKVRIVDDKLICHHMTDDYVIDIDDIEHSELGRDVDSLKFIKISGFGMDNLLKGSFSVNGESGCKVFLNPENGNYIKIIAKGTTYYIGAETAEETEDIYYSIP